MTQLRPRFIGDAIAVDFVIETDGVASPYPDATLEFGALDPDGTEIAGTAAWLGSPNDHIVRGIIAEGATTKAGRHEIQLMITDDSLDEPIRGRVYAVLSPSAV